MRSISFLCILLWGLVGTACKKGGEDRPDPVMNWTIDGGPVQTSDTTSLLSLFGYHTISGRKGNTSMYTSTNSTNTGLYSMQNANAGFGATITGIQYTAISGTVNIGSNTNRLLSGSFNSVLINGTVDTINLVGSFSNIAY